MPATLSTTPPSCWRRDPWRAGTRRRRLLLRHPLAPLALPRAPLLAPRRARRARTGSSVETRAAPLPPGGSRTTRVSASGPRTTSRSGRPAPRPPPRPSRWRSGCWTPGAAPSARRGTPRRRSCCGAGRGPPSRSPAPAGSRTGCTTSRPRWAGRSGSCRRAKVGGRPGVARQDNCSSTERRSEDCEGRRWTWIDPARGFGRDAPRRGGKQDCTRYMIDTCLF
jgi:hypothetical protein